MEASTAVSFVFSFFFAAFALSITALAAPPPRIHLSPDHQHLLRGSEPFFAWGVNYDHDADGRLLEDYWENEWPTVAADFREMQALGARVVRIHLQLARFMQTAEQPNAANLARLQKLTELAAETGLYLDLTGLACYHKQDVPAWYARLDESARWEVQARFWKAIATACHGSTAVFCYDLMNEPIIGGSGPQDDWLPGPPLGGSYFVQRITLDLHGRSEKEVAHAWIEKLTGAIRAADRETLITVGVIPWAQIFKGAKPLFYSPEAGGALDFVSIHLYPRTGKADDDLAALQTYQIGKPLVIEEIFPLSANIDETSDFIRRTRSQTDGCFSFYWGKTAAEYEKAGGLPNGLIAKWLRRFQGLTNEK